MDQKRKSAGEEVDSRQSVKDKPEPVEALVLFGGVQTMLPAVLQELGLAGKVTAQEIPGVPPTWKPAQVNDYLLGRCVAERDVEFSSVNQQTKVVETRTRRVLIFDTAVPGGFRGVWLGADLRLKLQDAIGKVYQITYTGEQNVGRNAKLNAMKSYQVFEIQPTEQLTE